MNLQFFIMSSLFFFYVFGVGYYFENVERSEKKLKQFYKDLDQFFEEYSKKTK